ncbi:hypothetical protein PG993_002798 [Apiospora rasikravindrae]|uniref:Uncharacterized protein n=1 Tax=Apiospora rasikravindrae TaxID=990691 RepID=A0ABR1TXV7_9PEZI
METQFTQTKMRVVVWACEFRSMTTTVRSSGISPPVPLSSQLAPRVIAPRFPSSVPLPCPQFNTSVPQGLFSPRVANPRRISFHRRRPFLEGKALNFHVNRVRCRYPDQRQQHHVELDGDRFAWCLWRTSAGTFVGVTFSARTWSTMSLFHIFLRGSILMSVHPEHDKFWPEFPIVATRAAISAQDCFIGRRAHPSIDDPISVILMVLFLAAAAAHQVIFQKNKKRGHLFVFSAMMFAFSLIRAIALLMRVVWASMPRDVQVAMAANILTMAGTVIAFIVNLFFTQRIIRGLHPKFGWSTPARLVFRFLVGSVVAAILMVIAVTVQSFYTLDDSVLASDRVAQLFAATFLAVLAFIPIPALIIAAIVPRSFRLEKFGEGSWTAKMVLVLFTSTLLSLGAWFRVSTNYIPRPQNDPAWYTGRAPYYVFNYVLDLIVTYTYMAFAFHRRFHIPNGAKGPGSYVGEKRRVDGDSETPYISSLNFSKSALSLKKPKPVAATPRPRSEVTLRGLDDDSADPPPAFFGPAKSLPKLPSTMDGEYDDLNLAMMTPTFAQTDHIRGNSSGGSAYHSSVFGGDTEIGSVGGDLHGTLDDMLDKIGSTGKHSSRLSQWGYYAYADAEQSDSGAEYNSASGWPQPQSIAGSSRRRIKRLSLNESLSSSVASPTFPKRNSVGIIGTATTAHIRSIPPGSASHSHSPSHSSSYIASQTRARSGSRSSGRTGSYSGSYQDRPPRSRAPSHTGSRGGSRSGSHARSQPTSRNNSGFGGRPPSSVTPRCNSLRTASNTHDVPESWRDSRRYSLPGPGAQPGNSSYSRTNSGVGNLGYQTPSSIIRRPSPAVVEPRWASPDDMRSETFHSIQNSLRSGSDESREGGRRSRHSSRPRSVLGRDRRSVSLDRMASMRTARSRRRSSASVHSYHAHPQYQQQ